MCEALQLPQSTVSRHLKVLADGAWLVKRHAGTAIFYKLVLDDLSPANRGLWTTVRDQIGPSGELAEDQRRLQAVLAERMTDSQSFFGRVAGEWDDVRAQLFGERFTPQALLALLDPSWVVADLGCGTGNASELLAPHVARVIAVDQSEPMLAAAKRRLAGVKNAQFVQASIDRVPLNPASVDATVSVLVLHHVERIAPALAEMRRLVKPGGASLVIDMAEHDRAEYRQTMGHKHLGFAKSAMETAMREAGFANVRYTELARDPEARGPGLFVAVGRTVEP